MSNTNKYKLYELYETFDGINWLPMGEYKAILLEENSYDCGYRTYDESFYGEYCYEDLPDNTTVNDNVYPRYTWRIFNETKCSGTSLYYIEKKYVKTSSSGLWSPTGDWRYSNIVKETDSSDCTCSTIVTYLDGTTSAVTTSANIEDYAFSGNTTIVSVELGDCVETIGMRAFANCTSLSSVTCPSSLITIGENAFLGCTALTNISLNSGLITIGFGAFQMCSSLSGITIPNTVNSIDNYAFAKCSSLTSIEIPSGVTSIGYGVFAGCSSLTSITIPDSITEIYDSAFSGCSSLTNITIPMKVTEIGISAFADCTSLSSVTFGYYLHSVYDSAFSGCSSLTSITINSVDFWGGDSNAFDGVPINGTIYYNCNNYDYSSIVEDFDGLNNWTVQCT